MREKRCYGDHRRLGLQQLEPRHLLCGTTACISEFMASNSNTLDDFQGDASDWIEIHNPTGTSLDLTGWHLTDSASNLTKWQFPNAAVSLIGPGEYLTVFASSKSGMPGIPSDELHTNFSLSKNGEYTALVMPDGVTVTTEFAPEFPPQTADISYGFLNTTPTIENYFPTPTPGAENDPASNRRVANTTFSVDRGFYDEPQVIAISTDTPDAQIRYTLDGSLPTMTSGTSYTGPITISGTTTLRAAAYKAGYFSSNVDTQTYLFLDNVLQQNATYGVNGSGLPSHADWGHSGADWEVDPAIVNHASTSNRLSTSDLRSVPTLSLVLPWTDMFGSGGNGIYISGQDSERAVSVEQVLPNGDTGFQINASIEIVGGSSVNRWKSDKLSMRLKFTEDYGPTKLDSPIFGHEASDSLDTIVLDATLNFSWTHPSTSQTNFAKFIQDQHAADLQRDAGGAAPQATYHHLYINGLYWGMYYVHERPDDSFAATYLGGDKDDYDVIKHDPNGSGGVVSGTNTNYNSMLSLARRNLSTSANYDALAAVLDMEDFADYMLVNFYIGNTDWAHQNWYASFNRVDPTGKWRYHSWDAEKGHGNGFGGNVNDDVTNKDNSRGPTEIHQNLRANAEYRMLFADRAQKHFFNDGAMTPENAKAAYEALMDEIDRAVVGESARWGDNRVNNPYTHGSWTAVQNPLLNTFFPQRTGVVLGQLRNDNLFPSNTAATPQFLINGALQHGGEIQSGDILTLSSGSGAVYYTLDGSDPRETGGGVSVAAIAAAGGFAVTNTTHIRARRQLTNGDWSALDEADFFVQQLADQTNLAVTEINYHPYDPTDAELAIDPTLSSSDFEFVELTNTSAQPVNLAGVAVTAGFKFSFDLQSFVLPSNGRVVIANNPAAFATRYGNEINVVGGFTSGSLSNGGETIIVRDYAGDLLFEFAYADSGDWPGRADGKGATLELKSVDRELASASSWRSSNEYGGTPGDEGSGPVWDVIVNEVRTNSGPNNPDIIELHNVTGETIDLSGWYLSDTSDNLFKSTIPGGTVIEPFGFRVLDQSQFDFGLSSDGDDVWLIESDATGQPLRFADHAEFLGAEPNATLGRWPAISPESREFITMSDASFGDANVGAETDRVRISEIHYNPSWFRQDFDDSSADGVQLALGLWNYVDGGFSSAPFANGDTLAHFPSASPLSDEYEVKATIRIPDVSLSQQNAAIVFDYQSETDFKFAQIDVGNGRLRMGQRTSVGWGYDAEVAQQLESDTEYRIEVRITGSAARLIVDGVERIRHDFGGALSLGNAGIATQRGRAIFDDITVGPLDETTFEFVELYNDTGLPLHLGDWTLDDAVDYAFPFGSVLDVEEAIVVVGFDPTDSAVATEFRTRMDIDASIQLFGPFAGRLDNAGELLQLNRPIDLANPALGYRVVDQVYYDDDVLWPADADGNGSSLSLLSPNGSGAFPSEWQAASPTPGGYGFESIVDGDYNDDGRVDAADFTVWRDTLGSTTDLRADGDQDGIVDEDDYDFWFSQF